MITSKFAEEGAARGVDDQERSKGIVKAAEGKRLSYRPLVKRVQPG